MILELLISLITEVNVPSILGFSTKEVVVSSKYLATHWFLWQSNNRKISVFFYYAFLSKRLVHQVCLFLSHTELPHLL